MKYFELDDEELVKQVNECYRRARDHQKAWRKECVDLREFRAGHQWSDDDKAVLEEQGRPPVVFNRSGTIIDAVVGNEITNRQEIRFLPRTHDDTKFNEIVTEIVRWVRQECNAEDEESDAFEDTLIGGMGWIETRIDYDENGEPVICMDAVDPVEMYWDTNARKHNLEDRKWQIREKWIPTDEARETWPKLKDIQPAEGLAPDLTDDVRNADPPYYEREATGYDKREKTIRVLEFQWVEHETLYVVQNPLTGQSETVNQDIHKKLLKKAPDLRAAKIRKPKAFRCYVAGKTLLERDKAPRDNGFNYQCITGKRDSKSNTFYGLMRGIKDPQEWANKFFSQILHIINSNSKGGFFWEEGALVNEQNAKEDLARPDGMVKLKQGGLNKIKERQMFNFPASIDRMLEFAISSIRDVPGVNLELLGMANREQAGVLESQRSRQALTVLAPIFSNLRRYRKNQGKVLLYFLREYIPEGRMIRVVGEDGADIIKLTKDPLVAEYDVIVEQSSTSPNAKTEAWVAIRDVLPVLQAAGMQPPKEIVDALPLPSSMTEKWKETIKNGPPPEMKAQMDQMNETIQTLQQENHSLKVGQQTDMAKIQSTHEHKMHELAVRKEQSENEMRLAIEKMNAEHEIKMQELALKREEMIEELNLAREKAIAEISMKREIHEADAAAKMDAERNSIEVVEKHKEENESKMSKHRMEIVEAMTKSMSEIAESFRKGIESAASKPRVLVYDSKGEPIGSKPVDRIK